MDMFIKSQYMEYKATHLLPHLKNFKQDTYTYIFTQVYHSLYTNSSISRYLHRYKNSYRISCYI